MEATAPTTLRCLTAGCLILTAAVGCGRIGSGALKVDAAKARSMGLAYDNYVIKHGGPPADEAAFRQHLQTNEDLLESLDLTADEVFVSPRSGGAFVWRYGSQAKVDAAGFRANGHEAAAEDGVRLVIGPNGMFEMMDESRFASLPHN